MEYKRRKSQEEYALELDTIVQKDVICHQNDWFKIDRPVFLLPENRNKSFLLATRSTGCELLMLSGGTNFTEGQINRVLGPLGNERFYICHPNAYMLRYNAGIREISGLQVVKEISFQLPADWYIINKRNGNWELRNLPR